MTTTYRGSHRSISTPARSMQFPAVRYPTAGSYFSAYFEEAARAVASLDPILLDQAVALILEAYTRGSIVFSCGNGGSAAIANHLQCDHLKGIRTSTDLRPRVLSLSSNVELLTAIANDVGYEDVFLYQLRAQSKPGDVLIAISSSGRSPNIVRCLEWAHAHAIRTIAFTGFDGGGAREIAEVAVHIDSTNYGVIEDLHQSVMHTMAQYIRQSQMTADAIASSTF